MTTNSIYSNLKINEGEGEAVMVVPAGFFNEGSYILELMIQNYDEKNGDIDYFHDIEFLKIEILQEKRKIGQWMGKELGQIRHTFFWK